MKKWSLRRVSVTFFHNTTKKKWNQRTNFVSFFLTIARLIIWGTLLCRRPYTRYTPAFIYLFYLRVYIYTFVIYICTYIYVIWNKKKRILIARWWGTCDLPSYCCYFRLNNKINIYKKNKIAQKIYCSLFAFSFFIRFRSFFGVIFFFLTRFLTL